MSLSAEVKDHRLIFEPSECRSPIKLTRRKAEILRKFLSDRAANYIDLTDDEGNYVETLKKRQIKNVEKAEVKKSENRRWICSFGTRHSLAVQCKCTDKFGVTSLVFMEWCYRFHKVEFSHQVTSQMQKEYLQANPLKNG